MKISTGILILSGGLAWEAAAQTFKYNFGSGKVETGYTQVIAATKYSAAQGYGFEGHNDQKITGDVKGTYIKNLTTFRDQIVAKKAIPIFVAPTARDGELVSTTSIAGLAEVMRETAKNLNVTLVDLNAMVISLQKALGATNRKAMYMDGSHFTYYGAMELGRCMHKGIKELGNTLSPFLVDEGPVFDPDKPDPLNFLTASGTVSLNEIRPGSITGQAGKPFARPAGEGSLMEFGIQGKPETHAADGKRIPVQAPKGD